MAKLTTGVDLSNELSSVRIESVDRVSWTTVLLLILLFVYFQAKANKTQTREPVEATGLGLRYMG